MPLTQAAVARLNGSTLTLGADPVPVRVIVPAVATRDKHSIDLAVSAQFKPGPSPADHAKLEIWIKSLTRPSLESADVATKLSTLIRPAVEKLFERIRSSEALAGSVDTDIAHHLRDPVRAIAADLGLTVVGSLRVQASGARHARTETRSTDSRSEEPASTAPAQPAQATHRSEANAAEFVITGGTKLARIHLGKPAGVLDLGPSFGPARVATRAHLGREDVYLVGCRSGVHVVDLRNFRATKNFSIGDVVARSEHSVNSVALTSDGTRLLATQSDAGLVVFDIATLAPKIIAHDVFESDAEHAPRFLVPTSDGGAVLAVRSRIWKFHRDKVSASTLTPGASVVGIEPVDPGTIVVIRKDGRCDVIDHAVKLKSQFELPGEPIASASCVSAGSSKTAVAKSDGRVVVGSPLQAMRDQHTFTPAQTTGPARFVSLHTTHLAIVSLDRTKLLCFDLARHNHPPVTLACADVLGHRATSIGSA